MAFKLSGTLAPWGGPLLRSEILASSITVVELDAVAFGGGAQTSSNGVLILASAGTAVLGHVKAIVSNLGVGLDTDGTAGAATGTFNGSFLTAATNSATVLVRAQVDISQFTMYSAEMSAALGTTAGSGRPGKYIDLLDQNTLDEASAADVTAQYHSWGPDPDDSTRVIANIFESSVFTAV